MNNLGQNPLMQFLEGDKEHNSYRKNMESTDHLILLQRLLSTVDVPRGTINQEKHIMKLS